MKKKISEHDALKGVDILLETLSEEERQRVFDWIVLKYKITSSSSPALTAGVTPLVGSNPAVLPSFTTIKDFISLKKPGSLYERVACLAYYLEKYQGYDGIKTNDISKANTDARQSKISNPTVYVTHATKTYGFLASIGGAKKGITPRGEALVEALPDRAAAKKALEDNPIKKKATKKGRSKKK